MTELDGAFTPLASVTRVEGTDEFDPEWVVEPVAGGPRIVGVADVLKWEVIHAAERAVSRYELDGDADAFVVSLRAAARGSLADVVEGESW